MAAKENETFLQLKKNGKISGEGFVLRIQIENEKRNFTKKAFPESYMRNLNRKFAAAHFISYDWSKRRNGASKALHLTVP